MLCVAFFASALSSTATKSAISQRPVLWLLGCHKINNWSEVLPVWDHQSPINSDQGSRSLWVFAPFFLSKKKRPSDTRMLRGLVGFFLWSSCCSSALKKNASTLLSTNLRISRVVPTPNPLQRPLNLPIFSHLFPPSLVGPWNELKNSTKVPTSYLPQQVKGCEKPRVFHSNWLGGGKSARKKGSPRPKRRAPGCVKKKQLDFSLLENFSQNS